MLGTGVEPARDCSQGILSPQCLPFHHPSEKELEIYLFEDNRVKNYLNPRYLFAILSHCKQVAGQRATWNVLSKTLTRGKYVRLMTCQFVSYSKGHEYDFPSDSSSGDSSEMVCFSAGYSDSGNKDSRSLSSKPCLGGSTMVEISVSLISA